jgi:hypothetical protein
MKTLIRIDPKSIRRNKAYGEDTHYVYGRPEATETRSTKMGDGFVTEVWRGTKVEQDKLVDGICVQKMFRNYGEPPPNTITVMQNVQPIYTWDSGPKFLYDYLPTLVVCKNCMGMVYHTELQNNYNDWDYANGCASELCDTICPWCRTWYCCEIEYEKLTDAELEKRMSEGINQVRIDEI